MANSYDIFISYRRKGGFDTAKHLYDLLTRDGYTVSFDIDTLRKGKFDETLINRIDECKDFILIIDSNTFTRILDPDFDPRNDWLRQELSYALKKEKNIIPIFLEGVHEFPKNLPQDVAGVALWNGPEYNRYYFNDFYKTIKEKFLTSKPRKPIKSYIYICLSILIIALSIIFFVNFFNSSSSSNKAAHETIWQHDGASTEDALSATSLTEDAVSYAETPAETATTAVTVYGGHNGVDLGLSVIWADCNLGAYSPSDYGYYYTWGETGWEDDYYCTLSSSICGNASYDAAAANWGGGWKMPTSAQCKELLNSCSWEWTSQDGWKGYRVTGPNGNSIFLPAAGYIDEQIEFEGTNGNYWSGSPSGSEKAWYISFQATDFRELRTNFKDRARSIRPVRNK